MDITTNLKLILKRKINHSNISILASNMATTDFRKIMDMIEIYGQRGRNVINIKMNKIAIVMLKIGNATKNITKTKER